LRCGGETTVSLYETGYKPGVRAAVCTDCSVGIYCAPLNEMFRKINIFVNFSGDAVSYIDVSLNGVDIAILSKGKYPEIGCLGNDLQLISLWSSVGSILQ
jgi:hypothetical protein